jgi:hypothetical protein
VRLTQCPYDSVQLDAETVSGGSVVLVCPACDAAWETHGAWVTRLREPDRERWLAHRRQINLADRSTMRRTPSPRTRVDDDRDDAPR